jgi:hypothetical protein
LIGIGLLLAHGRRGSLAGTKNPAGPIASAGFNTPRPFSKLFYVAASRPAQIDHGYDAYCVSSARVGVKESSGKANPPACEDRAAPLQEQPSFFDFPRSAPYQGTEPLSSF